MKKFLLLPVFFLLVFGKLLGQEQEEEEYTWPQPGKESLEYHEYRLKQTIPPYGLNKVKTMISKISRRADFEDEGETEYDSSSYVALSKKDFNSLTLREKFTYTMIHPEVSTQNCDVQIPILEENKKIFGHVANGYDEVFWSNRQINFLKNNRDSVMVIIKESALRSKRMGFNYKLVLEEINAVEMIPFLIDFYSVDKKDGDILTLLMLLMEKNNYEPFMKSQSCRKLYSYGDNSYYEGSYIDYNKANEELIITRAQDFYKQNVNK